MSPRARHAKSKSRIERYETLLADAGPETRGETQELFIPTGPRLGDVVVRAEGVRKAYGDRLLMEETGLPVVVADDPLTCVARGGGRILELMDELGPGHFGLE